MMTLQSVSLSHWYLESHSLHIIPSIIPIARRIPWYSSNKPSDNHIMFTRISIVFSWWWSNCSVDGGGLGSDILDVLQWYVIKMLMQRILGMWCGHDNNVGGNNGGIMMEMVVIVSGVANFAEGGVRNSCRSNCGHHFKMVMIKLALSEVCWWRQRWCWYW